MGAQDAAADGTSDEGSPERAGGPLGIARRLVSVVIAGWMAVVRAFSWLVARVVAVVLFVVGFVPYSLAMRLIGFDPLDRDLDADADSFWTTAEASNEDVDDFRRQY